MTDHTPRPTEPVDDHAADKAEGADATDPAAAPDNLFALKLVVVFLGVLLVVAAITFVMLLVLERPDEDAIVEEDATVGRAGEFTEMQLDLAPGDRIEEMSMGSRHLALRIESDTGERIVLVDPYTGGYRAVVNVERNGPQPQNAP